MAMEYLKNSIFLYIIFHVMFYFLILGKVLIYNVNSFSLYIESGRSNCILKIIITLRYFRSEGLFKFLEVNYVILIPVKDVENLFYILVCRRCIEISSGQI
jgi:hypothetical protein